MSVLYIKYIIDVYIHISIYNEYSHIPMYNAKYQYYAYLKHPENVCIYKERERKIRTYIHTEHIVITLHFCKSMGQK